MPESTIDPATFAELQDMAGAEFVVSLVETFFEEAPPMLAELRDAFDKRDADRFRRAAHSLKSNTKTFGALKLADMSLVLEREGLDHATPEALDAVDAEYVRVAAALKALADG